MSASNISFAQPEKVLKALDKLWTSIGEEERRQGQPPVLRACAMTLIVATDEPDEGQFASQTVSELMRKHPSRSIVLAFTEDANEELLARAVTQLWKPFGGAQQIGCEQIALKTRSEDWPMLGSVLQGLLAAGLPVVFWCRYRAIMTSPPDKAVVSGMEGVMDLASKTIVDTKDCPPGDALSCLAGWREKKRIVADLEWARLTRWREAIAHIFDNLARPNHLSAFHRIEIAHTDEKPTLAVLYMAAWLSAPHRAAVAFKRVHGFGPGVHAVTMLAANETIVLERTGKERMTITSGNGRERHFKFPDPVLTDLLIEELDVIGPDTVFDTALARIQELPTQWW